MALYTTDSIDRLKEAIDMVQLVGTRTDLRRVGARWMGLCPFHDERTPSFSVNAEHGLYHCFGCGESGDAIGFVRATEALDFPAAVELLADRYGIELRREKEDPRAEERRRRRERLLQLIERTVAYYARFLWDSGEAARARKYLAERGLGEAVLRDFRIGYSPSAWDRVILAAQRDGFTQEQIAAAGLGQRGRQGGFFDRFRGRIMFPLADARGRALGFGARAVRDTQQPKYLNTSENELYHKGRQLFGIDRARGPAAREGRMIVVEGYTDVLALHQAGVPESVAIMGTALTQEQLAELSRTAATVYMALDADRSGNEAMLRASRAAGERGVELRVVGMPQGADPAELIATEGIEAFTSLLEGALSVPEFQVRRTLAEADLETSRGRDQALEAVRPIVRAVPERSVTRDELVRQVVDRLEVPPDYVTAGAPAAVAAGPRPAPSPSGAVRARIPERPTGGAGSPVRDGRDGARPPGRWHGGRPPSGPGEGATRSPDAAPAAPTGLSAVETVVRPERTFLAMCAGQEKLGRDFLMRLGEDHFSSAPTRRVRDHLLAHPSDPLASLPRDDPALSALITEVVMLADEEPTSEPVLELGFLQLELRRIERQLRRVHESGDFHRERDLYAEREKVRARLDQVMGQTD